MPGTAPGGIARAGDAPLVPGNGPEQYRALVPSAASFIRAWRRMHRIFVRAGARNVTWISCPNAGHIADGIAQRFYPGSRYVDWVCADGYNWAPGKVGAPRKTFADIFSAFYQWGIRTGNR